MVVVESIKSSMREWMICSSLLWNVDDCVVVIVMNTKPNQIKNQTHSSISNQMKVVNVNPKPYMLGQDSNMIVDNRI